MTVTVTVAVKMLTIMAKDDENAKDDDDVDEK